MRERVFSLVTVIRASGTRGRSVFRAFIRPSEIHQVLIGRSLDLVRVLIEADRDRRESREKRKSRQMRERSLPGHGL